MIGNITPSELRSINVLMYLQRIAGIDVSFEEAIEGWRALSAAAQEQIITAVETAKFIKTSYQMGRQHGNKTSQTLQGTTTGERHSTDPN
jgi:tryptophan synthase beta subunit